MSGKFRIIRARIRRDEGRPFECVTREFEGLDALRRADIELRWWARTAPRDGSAHKITYWLTWEDEVRADTYRLTYEDRARASIGAHVLAEDEFWAGRRARQGMSAEQYASYLARWSDAYDDPTRRAAWIDARSFE